MSWKDYFYFTRTERNGITVLIIMIFMVILLPYVVTYFHTSEDSYDFQLFEEKVRRHEALLAEYLEARNTFNTPAKPSANPIITLTLFSFNPNELQEDQWRQMGLPDPVIRNIMNYRRAGGRFSFKEDMQRIYNMDKNLYNQIEPYIDLPSRSIAKKTVSAEKTTHQTKTEKAVDITTFALPAKTYQFYIDINSADTLEFQKLRGIGPVFSRRIVAYRQQLGGFYSPDQLLEIYGMDSSRYNQIKDFLIIDEFHSNIRQIDLNQTDFATLVKHPYLNRYQAGSIIRMREIHGNYEQIDQIKKSELINDSVFKKIAPYLITDPLP